MDRSDTKHSRPRSRLAWNFFAWTKVPYYRLMDLLASRRQVGATEEHIGHLSARGVFVTITGPPRVPVAELMALASAQGIRTADLATLSGHAARVRLDLLYADFARQEGGFWLIHVPAGDMVKNLLPAAIRRVLLLPAKKRYVRLSRQNLSGEHLVRAEASYDALAAEMDRYDIVLNENEVPRDLFNTLLYKLDCLVRLERFRQIDYPPEAARYQCFVIWGHGLAYRRELTEIIGREFDIIASAERKIGDIKRFTREMYVEEVLKIGHHILKKNEHLARYPRRAVLLLVKARPGEKLFACKGHGRAGNVCATFDQHFKQEIRDRYNPRLSSGERSEYHVVHAADTPYQVDNILRMFDLKPLNEWLTHD